MDKLMNLSLELKKSLNSPIFKYINISFIKELNNSLSKNIDMIINSYTETQNKFYMLERLVKFGMIIENISNNKDDLISIQLSSFVNIFNPIINKIKEICLELNNQVVNELKSLLENIIKSQSDISFNNKPLHIFSNVKIIYNENPTKIPFEDFGLCLKIQNLNDKYLSTKIIDYFNQNIIKPISKKENLLWVWKASNSIIEPNNFSININKNIFEQTEYVENIEQIENKLDDNIELDNLTSEQNTKLIQLTSNDYDFMKKQVGENLIESNIIYTNDYDIKYYTDLTNTIVF